MTPRIIGANLVIRLKSFSREKSAMFFTVAFPVILVLVFGAIFTKPEHLNFNLPIQDLDQTAASAQLIKGLGEDQIFHITSVPTDVDAAQYAREHKLTLMLVIPRGFEEAQSLRLSKRDSSQSVALTYVYDPSSTSVTTKLQYLTSMVAAGNQRMYGTPPFMILIEQSIMKEKYRFIEFFIPGIIAMAIMTSSLSGALNMNAELRQKGILRKLATTPITHTDWLLSNILYQLILAIVSTFLILVVSYAVFDVRLHINPWLPLFVVLAVFVFVGLGMLISPIAREAETAAAAANAFLFPMMFLSGTFFPVEMMPPFLQKLALVLPLYYLNEGLRAAMNFQDQPRAIRCAAIVAAVAVAVFVAGSILTRWDRDA